MQNDSLTERVAGKFFKPSTIRFLREARKNSDFSLGEILHGYIYGRWPYLYISLGTGEHPLTRVLKKPFCLLARVLGCWQDETTCPGSTLKGTFVRQMKRSADEPDNFADTYHGKVVPLHSARKLIRVDRDLSLPDLERVVPYHEARDIILRNPDHIALLDCPCRSSRENPCLPLDVCLIVGEPFAGFIIEHHPGKARWITVEEAVQVLEAEDRRGHVHHVFFKKAMLGRYYAICNCCSCCCGAMQAQKNGVAMLAPSGYLAQVDLEACIGCGTCEAKCQFQAVRVVDGVAEVDPAACMGCGVCVGGCPEQAVTLVRDEKECAPLEIDRLTAGLEPEDRTGR
ncbi:MAG TPA: 4Fe-4S binding protein [Desulfomicrobiaceae bacterium]|nr:4Fe-4S binding protein [Desulfomicrobiaceae bacterium]